MNFSYQHLTLEIMAGQDYREIAAIAQTRRYNVLAQEAHLSEAQIKSLPKDLTHVTRDPSLFSENEIEILEMKAEDLVRLIRHRTWTAIQVTEAFCKAAAIANQLVSLLYIPTSIMSDCYNMD